MRFILLLLSALLMTAPSFAQGKKTVADIPEPLQPLADRGAQLRYLGSEHGMDGWIAIYQGQEQYYYVTPDGKAFVTGLMFGNDGRPVTVEQVRELQLQSGDVLDLIAEPQTDGAEKPSDALKGSVTDNIDLKTPAERMFTDVENSNWFRLGTDGAPVVYTFIDPQCPHCHRFLTALRKDYIEKGLVQVRVIPVGFQQGSLAQAAFLLASPDPASTLLKHLDGDSSALPAKSDVSTQAIQKNMALMQAWKFNITPLSIYRGRDGKVKILRGEAKDIKTFVSDLPAASTALKP
jgi:thiol:disulfide interchange protein DsbG